MRSVMSQVWCQNCGGMKESHRPCACELEDDVLDNDDDEEEEEQGLNAQKRHEMAIAAEMPLAANAAAERVDQRDVLDLNQGWAQMEAADRARDDERRARSTANRSMDARPTGRRRAPVDDDVLRLPGDEE